jgi:trk system potassium uptake protein TrkH
VSNLSVHRHRLPPPAVFACALVVTIGCGALLLQLPAAQAGPPLSWVDVLFTATSAAGVTGLAVADTASQFTPLGQAILLALIQIGGLGVMTIGTMVLLAFGRRPMTIAHHLVSGLSSHQPTIRVRDILGTVVVTTAAVVSALVMHRIRGNCEVRLFQRAIGRAALPNPRG